MRTARLKNDKKITPPLLFLITKRTVLFLFLFLCVLILFFSMGNYQKFLDTDQRLILLTGTVTAIVLICSCIAGIIEAAVFLFTKKTSGTRISYSLNIVLMTAAAVFAAAVMIVFRVIDILSLGL